MKSYFLGFDLGSHASKAALIGEDGELVSSHSSKHGTLSLKPGWQEQSSDIWWEEFKNSSKLLLKESGIDPERIRIVGVTGFVPGLVMLDNKGVSIHPVLMHTDIRAVEQLKYINELLKSPISHGCLLPKLLWIRDNEKKTFERIHKILVPHSFIVFKLTGEYSCDVDTATVIGGIFDEEANDWSPEICSKFGINDLILPDLYNADSIVGRISREAAEETGLSEGTAVIAGTGDTFSALLGCGAVRSGDMMIYLGTSGTQIYIAGDLSDFTKRRHFGIGKAEFTGRIISCGDSMEHFRNLLGFKDWKLPDKKALEIKPGSEGLFIFPHLKQKTDTEISGRDLETIFGLESSHTSWHIYRALLEGIAYNLKTNFVSYKSKVKRLILSGGAARSEVFRNIIRDVLGIGVYYNPVGNGVNGIALLAGQSVSDTPLLEFAASWSDMLIADEPDPENVKKYELLYESYLSLQKSMKILYKEQEYKYGEI